MATKPLTELERKEVTRRADHAAEGVKHEPFVFTGRGYPAEVQPKNDPVGSRMKDSAEAQLDVTPDIAPVLSPVHPEPTPSISEPFVPLGNFPPAPPFPADQPEEAQRQRNAEIRRREIEGK